MNILMQTGIPRLEAEKDAAEYVREQHDDFSPLRV
jgi:hypothetical protein